MKRKVWAPKPYRPFPEHLQLYTQCPSFQVCSCNKCPLDAEYTSRSGTVPGDPDRKCRGEKPTRLRIVEEARAAGNMAVDYIPYGGLTAGEWSAKKRVESMTDEEKAAARERINAINEKRRLGLPAAIGSVPGDLQGTGGATGRGDAEGAQ